MREQSAYELLKKGLQILDVSFTEEQLSKFIVYLSELKKWNKAFNLTALKTDRDIVVKHFLDSLLFLKAMPSDASTMADIGSGAGFPGIPIRIMRPHLSVSLVEPTQKKVLFLRHIKGLLQMQNLEVINKRLESVEGLRVDVAVTRALFSVRDFIDKTKDILNQGGTLILSKGPKLEEELKGLESRNIQVTDYVLPLEEVVRHMVSVRV